MTNKSAPKNIIYVENGIGYGGAIICLRHLVRNLDRNKYNPLVITGRNSAPYQEIAHEVQWQHISDRHFDIVAARRKLDSAAWPDKLPGLRFVINQLLARADDLFNFLPFFISLLWTSWRFKADLVHANNEPLCNRAALMVGRILKIPTVCHVRGDQNGSHAMAWSYSLVDHFIPVSHWVAQSIQNKLNIPAAKISVIYDGLELDKLEINADSSTFRKQHNISADSFTVGLVGLLIPWKGQEIFLDAAAQLQDKIPNLKMLMVGGTPDDCQPYATMLRSRVKKEGLTPIVSFTGHVSNMPEVYNGLDIVVSASTSPEPLGTVVIESMTMARPLIGPDHGGAKEMMEHEVTGLLFQPGNATALANAINTFYAKIHWQKSMGTQARAHALQTFAIATHTDKVQKVYSTLLALK